MVTLKREENTENRYGGYQTRFSGRVNASDRFLRYSENTADFDVADTSCADTDYDNYLWEELKRTAPRRITPREEFEARYSSAPNVGYERTEYMSSRREPMQRTKRVGLSARGKILIAVYAAVILLFTALIIINALSINSYNSEISTMENRVIEAKAELTQAKEAYSSVNTDEMLALALSNGMKESDSPETYKVVPLTAPVEYEMETNWFDRFCDGISSAFGG